MLDFVEKLKHRVRELKKDVEGHLVAGRVRDMEQYKQLIGRLEGYAFVEAEIDQLLSKIQDD